ncbi:MAG: trigger factor [Planctomycetota bacterium]
MSSQVETPSDDPCRRKLTVAVESDRVESQFRQSFGELRSTVQLPGFRRGKAPKSVLERRFGEQIADDVKRDLVVEGIEAAIKEHDLQVVSDPDLDFSKIEFERGKGFEFSFDVEVRPTFDLPKYRGLKATRKVQAWTPQEVDDILEDLRSRRAMMVPVGSGKIENEDHVIGPFEVFEGDESLLKRETDSAVAGHEHEKIAGLELKGLSDQLVGKAIGDRLTFETSVPADYPVQDMQGKSVTCHFDIAEIKRIEKPELSDELAKGFGFDDLASFRTQIEGDLEQRQGDAADRAVEEDLINQLLGQVSADIPKSVVEQTMAGRIREIAMQRIMAGELDPDVAHEDHFKTIRDEEMPEVERGIRAWYLIEAIAKKERIFATETDIDARIVEMAQQEQMTPTKVREELSKNDGLNRVRSSILERKVRTFLTEEAEIAEEKGEAAPKAAGNKSKSNSKASAVEEEGGKSDD